MRSLSNVGGATFTAGLLIVIATLDEPSIFSWIGAVMAITGFILIKKFYKEEEND